MTEGPLQFTMREMQGMLSSPRFWIAIVGASVLLGLVGPFGTYDDFRLPARLAFWGTIALGTYVVGIGTVYLLARAIWPEGAVSALRLGLLGVVAGLPVTVVVWSFNALVYGDPDQGMDFLPLLAYCAAISAVVSALTGVFAAAVPEEVPVAASAESTETRRPRILDRLPAPQRGRLSHMSMQDHYVDIRTDRGGSLVLMRFADAIAEAEGIVGVQVHRSHWVAVDMVAETVRVGGRPMLRMRDGTLLPVSRGFLDAARKAGLA